VKYNWILSKLADHLNTILVRILGYKDVTYAAKKQTDRLTAEKINKENLAKQATGVPVDPSPRKNKLARQKDVEARRDAVQKQSIALNSYLLDPNSPSKTEGELAASIVLRFFSQEEAAKRQVVFGQVDDVVDGKCYLSLFALALFVVRYSRDLRMLSIPA